MKRKSCLGELILAGLYFFAALFPLEIPSAIGIIAVTICRALWLMSGVTCVLTAYDIKNGRGNNDG